MISVLSLTPFPVLIALVYSEITTRHLIKLVVRDSDICDFGYLPTPSNWAQCALLCNSLTGDMPCSGGIFHADAPNATQACQCVLAACADTGRNPDSNVWLTLVTNNECEMIKWSEIFPSCIFVRSFTQAAEVEMAEQASLKDFSQQFKTLILDCLIGKLKYWSENFLVIYEFVFLVELIV